MVYPVGALIRRRRGTGADLGRESQFCVGVCFFDRLLTRPTDLFEQEQVFEQKQVFEPHFVQGQLSQK
jgi:hypothetical protein